MPETLQRNIDRFSELLGWNDADKGVIAFVTLMVTDPRLELAACMIEDASTARLIDVLTGVLGIDRIRYPPGSCTPGRGASACMARQAPARPHSAAGSPPASTCRCTPSACLTSSRPTWGRPSAIWRACFARPKPTARCCCSTRWTASLSPHRFRDFCRGTAVL